jgi:hypothetical protein
VKVRAALSTLLKPFTTPANRGSSKLNQLEAGDNRVDLSFTDGYASQLLKEPPQCSTYSKIGKIQGTKPCKNTETESN